MPFNELNFILGILHGRSTMSSLRKLTCKTLLHALCFTVWCRNICTEQQRFDLWSECAFWHCFACLSVSNLQCLCLQFALLTSFHFEVGLFCVPVDVNVITTSKGCIWRVCSMPPFLCFGEVSHSWSHIKVGKPQSIIWRRWAVQRILFHGCWVRTGIMLVCSTLGTISAVTLFGSGSVVVNVDVLWWNFCIASFFRLACIVI